MDKIITLLLLITFFGAFSQNYSPKASSTEFLNSLSDSQRKKAVVKFENEKRTKWHYFPSTMYQREGLPLKEMDVNQRKLLHRLLKSYLSTKGYNKAKESLEAESILQVLDNYSEMRDIDLYYVTFYGDANSESIWAWSFEGHHLSLNFTIDGENVSYVPLFHGASPAIYENKKFLNMEEELAIKLINSFDKAQLEKAIFSKIPPADIKSSNSSQIKHLELSGLSTLEMKADQKKILFELIEEYISSMPEKLATKRLEQIKSHEINDIYFGWAGESKLTEPHYYFVQGKTFLIELDNTQNNANHIHRVWRNFDGDFGRDLIKEHYRNSKHH